MKNEPNSKLLVLAIVMWIIGLAVSDTCLRYRVSRLEDRIAHLEQIGGLK